MANKKISDFTTITDVNGVDLLLIDHGGTTHNTTVGALTSNISGNFIEKPAGPTNGQVLTYNGSTSTWVASAASNTQSPFNSKAWVVFDGSRDSAGASNTSATNRFIYDSYNISSVLNTSQDGAYIISFITPMLTSTYPVIGSASISSNNTQLAFVVTHSNGTASVPPSATGFGIATCSPSTVFNCKYVSIMVF